jgi:hypothetical protein
VHNSETCSFSFVENAQKITVFVVRVRLWGKFLRVKPENSYKLMPKGVVFMEKIKHRTIRFSAPKQKRSSLTAALAGVILGAMVITLCLMVIFILS